MTSLPVLEITKRSQEIFNIIVNNYLETGTPVGSGVISSHPEIGLSSASVRTIMAELEGAGLLFSPHTSSGRLPTHAGLRLFVDGLMELRNTLSVDSAAEYEPLAVGDGLSVNQALDKASLALSGLSKCAALVMAPSVDLSVNHIEFVPVQDRKILVILVFSNGHVENRLIEMPAGIPPHCLVEASNYMNGHYKGKSLSSIVQLADQDRLQHKAELDLLTSDLIGRGLASWSDEDASDEASLILNGQANLLQDVKVVDDLARVRMLFDKLEMRSHATQLMQSVISADGLQIFIGSEHDLFSETGCSVVLSPYRTADRKIIGAVGVIGPRHMNYARIIPMVDYTSKAIARFLS